MNLHAITSITLIVLFSWQCEAREQKFLSMFNVVRFPNDACDAGGSKNGTCYSKDECETRGGEQQGSCASGYGVCCIFTVKCGAKSTENNTYFESTGDEKGHCKVSICKSKPSIVQLRLDFDTFVLSQPSSDINEAAKATSGNVNSAGTDVTLRTRCSTDVFSVTNPNGPAPPQICGNNNNQHMYVDASDSCNDIVITLGSSAAVSRAWSIRITHYDSGFVNLAPSGCTQWLYHEGAIGSLQSYNYAGKVHLADQNQVVCIRREESKSKICYYADLKDISVSGKGAVPGDGVSYCGGYNAPDGNGLYRDALLIPSLKTEMSMQGQFDYSNICGHSMAFLAQKTLCSKQAPFRVTFTSDSVEDKDELGIEGFYIRYVQQK